jgi:hypothetical protein
MDNRKLKSDIVAMLAEEPTVLDLYLQKSKEVDDANRDAKKVTPVKKKQIDPELVKQVFDDKTFNQNDYLEGLRQYYKTFLRNDNNT